MKIAKPEVWEKWEGLNRDGGYGEAVLDFAVDWADLTEARMATGEKFEDVAKETSFQAAKKYGITGFQYGAAVSTLASCWEHGDQLRRWHNLDTQIGDEGEKANESGGTLNPALLNIRVRE